MPVLGSEMMLSHAYRIALNPDESAEPPKEFTEHWKNLELYESAKAKLTPDEYDAILAYEKPLVI